MLSSNQRLSISVTTVSATDKARMRTVLVVDDESTLRSALRRFFTRRGWSVCEAEDGEHARALLLDGSVHGGGFDAVLTDVRMPRLNGMELHAMVAAIDAGIARRFIFSSGDTGDEEAVEYLERTQCPVIAKPFELGSLLALVERVASETRPPAH
ncbi:MAG TPA: response regulator [Gemmatimonadaceae bacterium]|nr:response regulator [Gemmatimonadaceae bacterium]